MCLRPVPKRREFRRCCPAGREVFPILDQHFRETAGSEPQNDLENVADHGRRLSACDNFHKETAPMIPISDR